VKEMRASSWKEKYRLRLRTSWSNARCCNNYAKQTRRVFKFLNLA
jgi:hypothetical protein